MNIEDALTVLDQATSKVSADRHTHQLIIQALTLLREYTSGKDKCEDS